MLLKDAPGRRGPIQAFPLTDEPHQVTSAVAPCLSDGTIALSYSVL